jgi:hypothetical protein
MQDYSVTFMDMRTFKPFKEVSPLGQFSQIQSIAIHPSLSGIALGSFDGRVALTPFDPQARSLITPKTKIVYSHCQLAR